MSTKYDFYAKTIGTPENRRIEQYTATIMYHPAGEPGHVYTAQVLAHVRGDSLNELQASVADFAFDPWANFGERVAK